ncbi:hypothetical protein ACRAWD_10810 [Caulobacter segnis]
MTQKRTGRRRPRPSPSPHPRSSYGPCWRRLAFPGNSAHGRTGRKAELALPAGDVVYQLRRLRLRRPASPTRFAAFYAGRDVDGRLETQAQVDGRDVRVVFESARGHGRPGQGLGALALAAGVIAFALVLVVSLALGRRAELEGAFDGRAASGRRASRRLG